MTEISFHIQGSSTEPYNVIFSKHTIAISATCTCKAGLFGQYCKHRMNILQGSSEGIVSVTGGTIDDVLSWLPGSSLAAAMADLSELEEKLEIAKKLVSQGKKDLATAMAPHFE